MKVLLLDIETSPNQAFCWGIWETTISLNQMISSSTTLCYSAKWLGEREIFFDSVHQSSPRKMLRGIHKMLDQADVVATYNGRRFDLPTLNKEFILNKMSPPSPYKQVDLLQVARGQFRFLSNKLDYVAQALGLGKKVRHPGFQMWVDCLAGDEAAWAQMKKYNRQDVRLLEGLYIRMLPWIPHHPNHGTFEDVACCPKCGSEKFQQRGYAATSAMKYRRFQCTSCRGWFRGSKTVSPRLPAGKERHLNIGS